MGSIFSRLYPVLRKRQRLAILKLTHLRTKIPRSKHPRTPDRRRPADTRTSVPPHGDSSLRHGFCPKEFVTKRRTFRRVPPPGSYRLHDDTFPDIATILLGLRTPIRSSSCGKAIRKRAGYPSIPPAGSRIRSSHLHRPSALRTKRAPVRLTPFLGLRHPRNVNPVSDSAAAQTPLRREGLAGERKFQTTTSLPS